MAKLLQKATAGAQINPTRHVCLALLLLTSWNQAAAEDFTNAIHAYLRQCVETEQIKCGIVVGFVNEHGCSIVSCGKLDNGTDQKSTETAYSRSVRSQKHSLRCCCRIWLSAGG